MRLLMLLTALALHWTLSAFTLKEHLAQAPEGSFFVTQQDKTNTFLYIRSNDQRKLILEEVSIPEARMQNSQLGWRAWFELEAPGHTLWTISQIDLQTGALEETFSFTHQGWVNRADAHSFLSTLLNLSFYEIPDDARKKVGFPPKHGQLDKRTLWNPPYIVEGHAVPQTAFHAYYTRWPNDSTELSRRLIEIYLPVPSENYPAFFPSWIEVDGKVMQVKLRVIDSGFNALSPKPPLPYRPPTFIGDPYIDTEGLHVRIAAPAYFEEFTLLAEEADVFIAKPLSLSHTRQLEGNTSLFTIPPSELAQLSPDEPYLLLVSPKEAPQCTITSHHPLTINKSANN